MNISPKWVDVSPHLASRTQPVFFIERELLHGNDPRGNVFSTSEIARVGRYLTIVNSVLDDPLEWSDTVNGQYVRVPVTAYRTNVCALSAILATGLEIGVKAVEAVRKIETVQPIEELILVLGTECTQLSDSFRCYIGLSFRVGE